jgi:hypothetical protein
MKNFPKWWRVPVWIGSAGLLFLPLVAMQFTDEVNWTSLDFVVFGGLLLAALTAFEIVLACLKRRAWRIAGILAAMVGFLVAWVELAVGVFR